MGYPYSTPKYKELWFKYQNVFIAAVLSASVNPLQVGIFVCLSQELHHYVEEYVNVYEADDDEEWRLVISEVTAFMEVGMKGKDEFSSNRSKLPSVSLFFENPRGRTQNSPLTSARSLRVLRSSSRIFRQRAARQSNVTT